MSIGHNRFVTRLGGHRAQRRSRQRCRHARPVDVFTACGPDVAAAIRIGVWVVMPVAGPRESALRRASDQPFRRLEVLVQLLVKLLEKLVSHRDERRRRIDDEHQAQDDRVPGGEPKSNRENRPARAHGSPSFNTNPTPRTVCMSRWPVSASTFFRSRAIWTSITLSSGVARRGSLQTSRASISRDTKWPW